MSSVALVAVLGMTSAGAGTATTTTAPPTTAAPGTTAAPPTTAVVAPVVSITGSTDGWFAAQGAHVCDDAFSYQDVDPTIEVTASLPPDLLAVYVEITPPGALAPPYPGSAATPPWVAVASSPTTVPLFVQGYAGDVEIRLLPGAGYEVGEPSTVTVTVEDRSDPGCGPPTFTAAPANTAQQVPVGGALLPLDVVPYPGGTWYAALDSGSLPPGIELQGDGTFSGTATTPGTYVAVIGACTPAFVPDLPPSELTYTCTITTLRVVVGEGRTTIPVTG